jgi:hypothetical protein
MSLYRVIRLIGTSPTSWEEATKSALEEAAKHLAWISHEHVPIGQPSAGCQCACLIELCSAYQRDTSP